MSTRERLADMGVELFEDENIAAEMPGWAGCTCAWRHESGPELRAWVNPSLDELAREDFRLYAARVFDLFLSEGPTEPPWFSRSDGGWQIWIRESRLEEWARAGYPD